MAKLTPKQQRFVEEYLIDLNGAGAMRRAGYTSKNPDVDAAGLLVKPSIIDAIQTARVKMSERCQIKADDVLRERAKLAFSNMMDYIVITPNGDAYVNLARLTREQAAAITELTSEVYLDGKGEDAREVKRTKIKLADKRASLADIAKQLGFDIEKKEISGPDGGPIQVTDVALTDAERAERITALLHRAGARRLGSAADGAASEDA